MAYQSDHDGLYYEDERQDPNSPNYDPTFGQPQIGAPQGQPQQAAPAAQGDGYHGVDYWARLGQSPIAIDPGTGMAAEANGGLAPGWSRTATGYEHVAGENPTDWFTQNAPAPQEASVPAFGETYSTLARPDYLQGEYKPPVWMGGDFKAPSMQDVQSEAGYQTGLDAGRLTRERSAAANGSILNGGTQKALERYGQDYGATKYADYFGRALQTYQQKYGQYQDSVNSGLAARGVNENAYQNDVGNTRNQYLTRYQTYLDSISNNRTAQNDWWNQNQDTVNNSLTAASLARPNG